jgi:hypothetical protein
LPRYIRGYEAFVHTPMRRDEGFFIFRAWFLAGAYLEVMHGFSAAGWLSAVRRTPIQRFHRPWLRGMAFAMIRPGRGDVTQSK